MMTNRRDIERSHTLMRLGKKTHEKIIQEAKANKLQIQHFAQVLLALWLQAGATARVNALRTAYEWRRREDEQNVKETKRSSK